MPAYADIDPAWWTTATFDGRPMREILRCRDVGAVFRFLASRGWSRSRIGAATGLSETRVRAIARGDQQISSYEVLERIAEGLRIDRGLVGLAYREPIDNGGPDRSGQTVVLPARSAGPQPAYADHDDTGTDDETEDLVRRRNLGALAGAVAADVLFETGTAGALDRLAGALAAPRFSAAGPAPRDLAQAGRAVAAAKRGYQAGQYPDVLATLPALLAGLRDLEVASDGDEKLRSCALAADAYHVTASVLLKLGDDSMAAVAADRSLHAARRNGDPVAVAASTRIVVHTLMSTGHATPAYTLAADTATTQVRDALQPSPQATSVVGALLLRGAIAAARAEDRRAAQELLDEADHAARDIPATANLRWTGFNATNVALHRVHVALQLGDAGTAVDIAGRVDPAAIGLGERRASLHLDVAQAYAQWGKWDRAWSALLEAETAAPHEVRTRPATRGLIAELAQFAPRSMQPDAVALARRAGILR